MDEVSSKIYQCELDDHFSKVNIPVKLFDTPDNACTNVNMLT